MRFKFFHDWVEYEMIDAYSPQEYLRCIKFGCIESARSFLLDVSNDMLMGQMLRQSAGTFLHIYDLHSMSDMQIVDWLAGLIYKQDIVILETNAHKSLGNYSGEIKSQEADKNQPRILKKENHLKLESNLLNNSAKKDKIQNGPPALIIQKTWIEIQLVDKTGHPIVNEPYMITKPDGDTVRSRTDKQGIGRLENLDSGTCKISFPKLDKDVWHAFGEKNAPIDTKRKNSAGTYIPRQLETIDKIAKREGLFWETIAQCSENKSLCEPKKAPYVMGPQEEVYIPALEKKEEKIQTTKRHIFQTRSKQTINVCTEILHDMSLPESWDDKCILWSTADNGKAYKQEVLLIDHALSLKEDSLVTVVFTDVIPDLNYSCMIDLGQNHSSYTSGGYLVWYDQTITENMSF